MTQALPSNHNHEKPYDPFAAEGTKGNPDDTAYYILQPGVHFHRPWLRVPGGETFVWPLGIEGFNLSIEPVLGIHKYIGDNAVEIDVVHLGEETFRMSGIFPGLSSVANLRALRDVVYAKATSRGKILHIPHILSYAQRVVVAHAEFDHPEGETGFRDLTYSIEFKRMGTEGKENEPPLEDPIPQPTPPSGNRGQGHHKFVVNARYNTLRKIAKLKLGSTNKWRVLYDINASWFVERNIPMHKAPGYRLPIGTKMYY